MLDVLIGCIWRYIYRPRPRLYKEGGGPNSKYKDIYRYTITTEDTHLDIQDMYLNTRPQSKRRLVERIDWTGTPQKMP
jgi:hypothetical protein